MNTTKTENTTREALENLLRLYDVSEESIKTIIAYIDGVKMGTKFINTTKENERMKKDE